MTTLPLAQRCPRCHAQPRQSLSVYCVACQAIELHDFHEQCNAVADVFAAIARQRGDEKEARRIEKDKRRID